MCQVIIFSGLSLSSHLPESSRLAQKTVDNSAQPYISESLQLQLGDLCVFKVNDILQIGHVLKFAKYYWKAESTLNSMKDYLLISPQKCRSTVFLV